MRQINPGLPHHIILRGNNRRRLFSYPTDYKRFLWDLVLAMRIARVALHALVLMKNHLHLIATPPDAATLARFIQRAAQRYAQTRNRIREATGKLFEQRFLAIPISSERQLAVTTAYVELNPVRAGVVRDPAEWAWSTYGLHAGIDCAIPASLWTPSSWYLDLADDPETRSARYAAWAEECRERSEQPERVEKIRLIEALSSGAYTRRLRRPNESSAM
jgi:putative transposase